MIIQQLSVFLENKSGRLTDVTESLARANINITALSMAETSEYGILRLIVSDAAAAISRLKEEGFSVGLTDVLCLSCANKPGSLSKALRVLSDADIAVEYLYAFSMGDSALSVIRTEKIRDAIAVLNAHGIDLKAATDL